MSHFMKWDFETYVLGSEYFGGNFTEIFKVLIYKANNNIYVFMLTELEWRSIETTLCMREKYLLTNMTRLFCTNSTHFSCN